MTEHFALSSVDVATLVRVPTQTDDKYSRGVVGFVTGSTRYPGAAVLGVEAALRTGVGMVRYLGPARPTELVMQRRPEAVADEGRVQAWVVGSGMHDVSRETLGEESAQRVRAALESGHPIVIDAGAIDAASIERAVATASPAVITPHAGELARLLERERSAVADAPLEAARDAAAQFGVVVLLKGHTTRAVAPGGDIVTAQSAPAWLATAGAGDALGGVLGALLASRADDLATDPDRALLTRLAAGAAVIHGLAAERASGGGPLTVLDLCAAISPVIAELVAGRE